MPLATPATTEPSELDVYVITEVPDAIPRDQYKRPLIVPREGGPPVAYTRASTLGKAIDDTYHLNLWKLRTVVYGMSRNKVLVAQASAVETNEGSDRKLLDGIAEKAHEAGKGNVGADIGTALHKLSERADTGEDMSWLAVELHEAIFAYLEQMKLFKVLAAETFVACDEVQSAGSFDRVVVLLVDLQFDQNRNGKIVTVIIPAGTVLVVDLKTGKASSAKYWGPTYGVQQTVYACGEPYLPGRGRITWEELLGEGMRPSTDWALILHVPGDSPADAGLMVVDLEDGRVLADLAVAIREARKLKSLLTNAYPVPMTIDQEETPAIEGGQKAIESGPSTSDLMSEIQIAPDSARLGELFDQCESIWTDEHTMAAKNRMNELSAVRELPDLPDTTDPSADAPDQSPSDGPPEVATPRDSEPAQVRRLNLVRELQLAKDQEVIDALFEAHEDIWDANCTSMVKARMRQLAAEASA